MATYTLKINIDQDHVRQFNKQKWKLCFAAGVSSSDQENPQYTVIAHATQVAAHVTVTWTEKYEIGATSEKFDNGAQFDIATDLFPISFGQSYTQPEDWSNGTVNNDPKSPKNGFRFINQTDQGAAAVAKVVNNKPTPIYVSPNAPLPPGTETLIPKVTCAVWFQSKAETGNMISDFTTEPQEIDLTQNTSHRADVSYDKDGKWTINSNN